jgi:histidinol-phosphate aminotransferase
VRLGILAAAPSTVCELNKIRMPYNINVLSQVAARVVLEQEAEIQANLRAVRRERTGLRAALVAYPDVEVFPSDANFFLIRTPFPADAVHAGLARRGVSVRRFGGDPALARCLRVTVGRPEENIQFLEALKGALEEARRAGAGVWPAGEAKSEPGKRGGAQP